MFDSHTNTGLLTVEEWDAEERLIFELMDAGPDPVPSDEPVVLPSGLESWAPDLRLAAVLSVIDVNPCPVRTGWRI
jgi:hypothetical protein